MTKYNVHIFRELRLYYPGIEAESHEAAAEAASKLTLDEAQDIHECDGSDFGALVDVPGDDLFIYTRAIDFEPGRMLDAAASLLEALDYLLEQTVDQDLKHGITLTEGEAEARAKALAAIAKARAA